MIPLIYAIELDVDLAAHLKASNGLKDSNYDSDISIYYLPPSPSPTPGPCPPSLPLRINSSYTVMPDDHISGSSSDNPGGKPPNTVDLHQEKSSKP